MTEIYREDTCLYCIIAQKPRWNRRVEDFESLWRLG